MKAMDNGGDIDYERPRPGSYVANCFRIIDIGTQDTGFKDEDTGEPVNQRKIFIGWEINQLMGTGKPFTVQSRYTLSLHKKSALRPLLESWRGEPFNKEDLAGFEMKRLLGKQCLLSLVETEDKKYTNIKGALKLPEGMPKMQPVNPQVYFSLEPEEFSSDTFEKLPDWLKKLIVKSPEYKRIASGQTLMSALAAGAKADDIPF